MRRHVSKAMRTDATRKTMKPLLNALSLACVSVVCLGAAGQPRVTEQCVEPFATSNGYVLSPRCPPKALAALAPDDPLNLRPSLDPNAASRDDPLLDADASRKQPLRLYERRLPGTEIYLAPSPLRNQWMYNPGQVYGPSPPLTLNPREAASDLVFGVRVPF